jgi:chromosome segregation ATPase
MVKFIAELWPVFFSVLMCIVWLIRLEAKVVYLERESEEHWHKMDEVQKKLDSIAESLARLEGKLESKFNDL